MQFNWSRRLTLKEFEDELSDWGPWYAWKPVTLGKGPKWAWRETVLRRADIVDEDGVSWEYK